MIDSEDTKQGNKRPFPHKFLPHLTITYIVGMMILTLFIHRASPAPVDAQELRGVGLGHWYDETGITFFSGRHLDCKPVDNIPPFTTQCQIDIAGKTLEIYAMRTDPENSLSLGACEAFYDDQQWPCKIGARHVQIHGFAYIEPALGLSNAEMDGLRQQYFFETLSEMPFIYGGLLAGAMATLLIIANFVTWFWTRVERKWILLITAVCAAPILFYATLFIMIWITGDFWD